MHLHAATHLFAQSNGNNCCTLQQNHQRNSTPQTTHSTVVVACGKNVVDMLLQLNLDESLHLQQRRNQKPFQRFKVLSGITTTMYDCLKLPCKVVSNNKWKQRKNCLPRCTANASTLQGVQSSGASSGFWSRQEEASGQYKWLGSKRKKY